MASTAQVQRDVLQFENGLAYEIALKYGTGKVISNGRVMFSTTDGEVFFVSQDDADKIYELELRPQERFKVTKTRSGLEVERIPHVQAGRQATVPPAVPATKNNGVESDATSQAQNNSLSGIMASSYIAAIDALLIAKDYADKKGIAFKISSMELRASAHCLFIAATKNGVTR
jgi:hypothetical protein